MEFVKHRLGNSDMGYAVNAFSVLATPAIIAASEARGGAITAFTPPDWTPRLISEGVGGCMGTVAVPGRDDAIFSIGEFFPIFEAENAGIYLHTARFGWDAPWETRKIVDMPFVHRIAAVTTPAGEYLIGATVCGGKDFRDDWSRPGRVYAIAIPRNLSGPWTAEVVSEEIHINHGMTLGHYEGESCLIVSGIEGVIALQLPGAKKPWEPKTILQREVSEVALIDLDDDGTDELAVIEPFHGNRLAVYKKKTDTWFRVYDAPLSFGHGLSAGRIAGKEALFVGNRADHKNLQCYYVASNRPFRMECVTVDPGSGTAGTAVVETPRGPGVVASNPEHSEYAFYTTAGYQ